MDMYLYKKLEHKWGTPINPEELYYYDHDFEEACEIFIELLSSNLVTPQYDIREKVDWGNTRRSSEIGKIIDRGNVDYSAIEKVYDFE